MYGYQWVNWEKYTQSDAPDLFKREHINQIDYVIEVIYDVFKNRKNINGLKIIKQTKYLRHFSASLRICKLSAG